MAESVRPDRKPLPEAARRALEEAAARRAAAGQGPSGPTGETGRKDGPEPTRFGDWENKGIASDF